MKTNVLLAICASLFMGATAFGQLTTFTSNTTAKSADVNANFTYLLNQINALKTRCDSIVNASNKGLPMGTVQNYPIGPNSFTQRCGGGIYQASTAKPRFVVVQGGGSTMLITAYAGSYGSPPPGPTLTVNLGNIGAAGGVEGVSSSLVFWVPAGWYYTVVVTSGSLQNWVEYE